MHHRLAVVLGLLPVLLGVLSGPLGAEEPWEAAVRQAEQEEDRLIEQARLRGTLRQLVARYASRASRQPTALNLYLLGRVTYYDGDPAAAERHLRRALEIEPAFWFARLRLAMLALERERSAEAERQVVQVLGVRPREPSALRLLARIRMEQEDWTRARRVLEDLLALDPTSEAVRRNLAYVHMETEDWPAALAELRVLRGRHPEDPSVRWYYANALYRTGDLVEAARELEGLVRLDPQDLRPLDMLRAIYVEQEDWASLERTLERMLPLVPDEGIRARIQEALEQLARGPPEAPPVEEAPATWPEDAWATLVERCMHPTDVAVRREALQAYYEAGFVLMPTALVRRIHPSAEPDAVCRCWVLRIMGALGVGRLAQVAAYALYDPDPRVRVVAAECLGEIGTPSGAIYLFPHFPGPDPISDPTEGQVTQMNATRAALSTITGHRDAWGGAEAWIDAAGLPEARRAWLDWLGSADGVHFRLRALRDLAAQEELRPELYLLGYLSDPTFEVAKAAYEVLLTRADRPSDDPLARAMWPRFPRIALADLTPESLPGLRAAVEAWWGEWLARREAGGAEDG